MSDVANTLRRLGRELRGCHGAFTMDYDGLPLEVVRSNPGGPDLDVIGAELAAVIREARQAALELGLGFLKGVTVRAHGPTMVFQACGRDYLLGAVLEPGSSAAVARRALEEAAQHDLAAL